MKLERNITLIIHFILDELLPPIIRDRRWFMGPIFRISLGKDSHHFLNFKKQIKDGSAGSLKAVYEATRAAHIDRETDLNRASVERIESSIVGTTVLDIASGRGYLSKRLAKRHEVVAADFVQPAPISNSPNPKWEVQDIESLSYRDGQFDTVVSTHTLEHVVDIAAALRELRRVCDKRLILVLPKQRAYQYTFDLHLHFFTYRWQLELVLNSERRGRVVCCDVVGGDWFYIEDMIEETAE